MALDLPVIGRLRFIELISLLASLVILCLEGLIRIITLALPGPVIALCYRVSRRVYNQLSTAASKRSRNKKKSIVKSITQASDFVDLCELYGYAAEEHIVQTKDGYLLSLHRLAWREDEQGMRVNSGESSIQKKVVFCMHGLLMNSEVWVCLTEKERCLPFQLVDQGYDVWFGNNRGNKYSKKSTKYPPTDARFWSFSIDQFAFHDIPDSIDYILETTHQPSLSYIGFSQGTAQAFASLSIHPTLNDKVDVFVALAPAMSPPGLSSPVVNSLVKASPNFLFLAFGRRAILSSATMWEALLYPPIFVRLVDMSTSFLFGWHNQNMTPHQKLAAYPHLYSFTSTKSVVHWFQIIRNGKFQMYDDEIQGPLSFSDTSKYYKVAKFPTRNIKTPIVLLYGGSDSLVDIQVMLKELPRHAQVQEIQHYEHLDFLWAQDVDKQVFPHVFEALENHTTASPEPKVYPKSPYPLDQSPTTEEAEDASATDEHITLRKHSQNTSPVASKRQPPSRVPVPTTALSSSPTAAGTDRSIGSRPEGWWSSDEVAGIEPSPPPTTVKPANDSDAAAPVPLTIESAAPEVHQLPEQVVSRSGVETAYEQANMISEDRGEAAVASSDAAATGDNPSYAEAVKGEEPKKTKKKNSHNNRKSKNEAL